MTNQKPVLPGGPGHDQKQLLDEASEVGGGLLRLIPRLQQQLLQVLRHLVKVPGPIRSQYSGHVTSIDQSEASIRYLEVMSLSCDLATQSLAISIS